MQVGSLIALLQGFESLVETIGGSSQLADIREFRRLLVGQEGTTVAQLAGKLAKGRAVSQSRPISTPLRGLQNLFAKLQTLLVSANGKKAADDIAGLIRVLDGCDQANLHQFIEEAKDWLANPSKGKPRSSKESKNGTGSGEDIRTELVRNYASALSQTSEDNSAFDRIVSEIRVNKKVRAQRCARLPRCISDMKLQRRKVAPTH